MKCNDCQNIPTIKVTENLISIMCKCTNVTISSNWWIDKKTIEQWKQSKQNKQEEQIKVNSK